MKPILLFFLSVLIANQLQALVSNYQFSSSSSTYTPITGGTVLGTSNLDDASYPNRPIGFSFDYQGSAYTSFSINCNGFICMGATISNSYTPISSGTSNNVMSALGGDNLGNTGTSELRFQTIGAAPNRILVVQWTSFRHYGATGNWNFQIRLEETTNRIIFHYGTMTGSSGSYTRQVGLRGGSNADFNNRSTTTNWASTVAGTLNTASCTISGTIYPANGQKFIFIPPCSTPVIQGSTTVLIGSTNKIYTTEAGMNNYTWTVSSGGTITSGSGTNTIEVTWTTLGTQTVSVNYTTQSGCIPSTPGTLSVNVVSDAKILNLNVFLESLFVGGNNMHKAQNVSGDQFSGSIADLLTIELHNSATYSVVEYIVKNNCLNMDGSVTVTVPITYNGSYYITVKHRNSIETVSALPVSFSADVINYTFDLPGKAYGNNLKLIAGKYCIYGGNVDVDELIDASDMIAVDNLSRTFSTGYLQEDANGDGLVDSGDMIIVDNNARVFAEAILPAFPVVSTAAITNITSATATGGGNVTTDGGSVVTARGVCWSTSSSPTIAGSHSINGGGTGTFTSNITGLSQNTPYYVRAYATNSVGTAYGNEVSFTTLSGFTCGSSTVMDIDNNIYSTVSIGSQCWMAENLKVTHYRNGTSIEYPGTNNTAWENDTTGAYAWYENDIAWKDLYGALYNWHAVNNANGLCPTGWHVPSDAEWTQLTSYIPGGTTTGGNQLKSCRQVDSPLGGACNTSEHPRWSHYNSTIYGTDDYDFSALPGGFRYNYGSCYNVGRRCEWWSSTASSSSYSWQRTMYYDGSGVYRYGGDRNHGFSVRCVRD